MTEQNRAMTRESDGCDGQNGHTDAGPPWRLTSLALGMATVAGTVISAAFVPQGARLTPDDAEPWTASRLKQVMRDPAGQRLIVVSNRGPLIHTGDGIAPQHAVSGLVTALEPVIRACSGVWVAHGSGTADRQASDSNGRVTVSADGGSYVLRRVWLTDDEERGYYDGFADEALWPLCHRAHAQPLFSSDDWAHYRRVNQRFADLADEACSDEPLVLVQDYHFGSSRACCATASPGNDPDLLARSLAERRALYHLPLSGRSTGRAAWEHIIGLQTSLDCRNFLESVDGLWNRASTVKRWRLRTRVTQRPCGRIQFRLVAQ